MNKILVLLVFSHQQSPCTWSLPCLKSRTHFKQNMGELVDSPNFYKWKLWTCHTRIKLRTKMGLAEKGEITTRCATTRILIFSANCGTWSTNFTRRSPVRRTYNTEPSPKELAWGRSTPMYPGKYSFSFCFSFSFF